MWHVTYDLWHVKCDTWKGLNIPHLLVCFTVWDRKCLEDSERKDDLLNESIRGLLITGRFSRCSVWHRVNGLAFTTIQYSLDSMPARWGKICLIGVIQQQMVETHLCFNQTRTMAVGVFGDTTIYYLLSILITSFKLPVDNLVV